MAICLLGKLLFRLLFVEGLCVMTTRKRLLDEFVLFTVVEPIFTVLLGLAGVAIALVRLCWSVLLGFLLIGWICETIIALLAWSERGLIFWFYFGGLFLVGLIAKRVATFPVKKATDWFMAGGFSRRRRDEPFADVPPGQPVIRLSVGPQA